MGLVSRNGDPRKWSHPSFYACIPGTSVHMFCPRGKRSAKGPRGKKRERVESATCPRSIRALGSFFAGTVPGDTWLYKISIVLGWTGFRTQSRANQMCPYCISMISDVKFADQKSRSSCSAANTYGPMAWRTWHLI